MKPIVIPWLSVVIPTYGRVGVGLTERCLSSLRVSHDHLQPEIFVVDDGSEVDVQRDLYQLCEQKAVQFVPRPRQGGFAKAVNSGMRLSNGVCVVLLNNDVWFDPAVPTLQIMADSLRSLTCGAVGTRLLYPDGTIQHAGVVFVPAPGQPIPGYFDHVLRGESGFHPAAVTIRKSLVTGACFAISRNLIHVLGFLDERYGMAAEDIDYCLDAIRGGFPVIYNGYCHAYHDEGKTRGRTLEEKVRLAPEAWEKEQAGLVNFFDKWSRVNWEDFSAAESAG